MSLLTIVQDACVRVGLARPGTVIGSTADHVKAMITLSNQDGRALVRRHDWQRLIIEQTFTATATTTQSGVLPSDFDRIIPGTFFNRSQDRRVAGPLSPQRWQSLQTGLITLPYDSFRIRGNDIIMSPTPTAGDSMAFEYVTKYWCASVGDTDPDQTSWVVDTDEAFLDEELMTLGVVWRFKKARGLDYGEDMQEYEHRLASLAGTDGGQATIDLGVSDDASSLTDPYLTDGNWSIS